MKKVLLGISLCLFSVILGFLILTEYKVNVIRLENRNLEIKIKDLSSDDAIIKEKNLSLDEKLNNIKKEKESIIKEKEIWEQMKERIEQALSQ